eukprot:7257393-Pyramimonas_sp.AAC.1
MDERQCPLCRGEDNGDTFMVIEPPAPTTPGAPAQGAESGNAAPASPAQPSATDDHASMAEDGDGREEDTLLPPTTEAET